MKRKQYQRQLDKLKNALPAANIRRWIGLYYDELPPQEKRAYCRTKQTTPEEHEAVRAALGLPLHYKIEPPGKGLTLEELERMVNSTDPDEYTDEIL